MQVFVDDVSESTNCRDASILWGSSILSKAPALSLEILIVVTVDSKENNLPQLLTAPVLKGRRLFHSPDGRSTGLALTKCSRAATTCSTTHKVGKARPKFKATHDMDFNQDVAKGLALEELTETYISFWVKPSRFLNHIFVPIEEFLGYWYCMVVDFGHKVVYHLDSYPDPNMIAVRE
ncbi:hypothetical protein AHAS_Ahas12G0151600 [Arachis hypogaea]